MRFAEERERLAEFFPEPDFRIEHVGSTAVPGLGAKPIIDIMLGGLSLEAVESRIKGLESLGYEYLPQHEQVMPQRRFCAKPVPRPRHFHLHGVVIGDAFWNEHLAFRDALRANEALARQYQALKQRLAAEFGDDREGYIHSKSGFIAHVLGAVL